MTSEFKPGQLVAHKTQPDVPWVVTVPTDEREGLVQDVGVAYIPADGKRMLDYVLSCELVPFADAIGRQFDALLHAIRDDDDLDGEVRKVLLARIEESHDEYVEWADGQRVTEGDAIE